MFNTPDHMTWAHAFVVLALLIGAGFAVSWITTDILRVGRARYIAVLAGVTALTTVATVRLAHVSSADLLAHNWVWGVVGGIAVGAVVGFGIRKMPAHLHRAGHALHEAEAWEGVVYGICEGVLLSALPTFVAWQAAADADWSTGAAWAAGLGASAAMIAIHHFGYWDFRNPRVLEVVAGCLIITLGYLATGSMVAPALAHVIMHIAGVTKGVELPPHQRVRVRA